MLNSADTFHIDLLTKTQFTIAKEVFRSNRCLPNVRAVPFPAPPSGSQFLTKSFDLTKILVFLKNFPLLHDPPVIRISHEERPIAILGTNPLAEALSTTFTPARNLC